MEQNKSEKKCKYCSDGRISLVNLFHAGIKMPEGECVTFSPEETYYRKTKGSTDTFPKRHHGASWQILLEYFQPVRVVEGRIARVRLSGNPAHVDRYRYVGRGLRLCRS